MPRVAHGEAHLVRGPSNREDDLARVGELDRVRQQVEQDLAHALRVGHGARSAPSPRLDDESCTSLPARRLSTSATHARASWRHVHRREAHVEAARLRLGEIEHVVDEGEQVLAVSLDALERLARARGESCSLGDVVSRSAKPRMALSGVRSSWLIDARNSVLTLFARVERLALLGEHHALLAQAVVRPGVVQRRPASWRAASRTNSARSSASGWIPPMSTRPGRLVAQRDGLGEHPAQRRRRRCRGRASARLAPKSSLAEEHRLAPLHHGAREARRRRSVAWSTRPPVGRDGVHRHEAVRVVEQVDDADLRPREPHERLSPPVASASTSSVLQLAHELGVRARVGVARGEVRVRARELGHERARARRAWRAGSRPCRAGARSSSRGSRPHGPELVAPRGESAPRRSSRPVASSASSSCDAASAMSRAIQAPLPERDDDRQQEHARRRSLRGGRRLERGLLAGVRRVERLVAELGGDGAHVVGARLALAAVFSRVDDPGLLHLRGSAAR